MPLQITHKGITLHCACGEKWAHTVHGFADFYAHLDTCPVLRCAHCLKVLTSDHPFPGEKAEAHRCG